MAKGFFENGAEKKGGKDEVMSASSRKEIVTGGEGIG